MRGMRFRIGLLYISVIILMICVIAFCWQRKQQTGEKENEIITEEMTTEPDTMAAITESELPMEDSPETVEEQEIPEEAEVEDRQHIVDTVYDIEVYEENGIEFHKIAGDTWQGLMMVIPDAERVFVGMPRDSYNGQAGADAGTIAKRYDAMAAVNGAFFVDTNQAGNGGTPIGFVFSEGRQTYGGENNRYSLIGLNQENALVCGTMTGAEAIAAGVRDAVTCNPILVQNGMIGDLSSKNTSLRDARTAVGGREDGSFLILVIDGRMPHSIGATTLDEAEVMLAFGAVAAGNLDGGGSVSVYYEGTLPEGFSAIYGTRPVPNAICIKRQ